MRTLSVFGFLLALLFGLAALATFISAPTVMQEIFAALMALGFMLALVVLAIVAATDRILAAIGQPRPSG